MVKRITIIVMDSLGVGQLEDSYKYGDAGADTLGHILDNYNLKIPNLRRLGMGNIDDAAGGRLAVDKPEGAFGRLKEMSTGKDTITGHWEIAGIYTGEPFKTYPDGFPNEVIDRLRSVSGRGCIGNCAASGTEIIEELGPEHERTGDIIVYTSADSVLQIAANVDVVPLDELYSICTKAREIMQGEFACGRIIARPYKIVEGKRVRTADRRDYAVSPPEKTMLNYVSEAGKQVRAVGKIRDIFDGSGITEWVHTQSNDDGVNKTIEYLKDDFEGLIFTNLVDFDSVYGHRRDPIGYGKSIEAFDKRLPDILAAMTDEDLLIICSDHGNDPVHSGWDHTREHIFVLLTGDVVKGGINLGERSSFADIGATVTDILTDGKYKTSMGVSFKERIL
ncbi:MAG: phosphopentomutase [Clostridiales bacterium]|nr:phosphopentomutase [Clostridiales bacterium]